MKKTTYAALTLLATALLATTGVAQTTHDIGTVSTITFNAGDSLTNTTAITDWDNTTLVLDEGSDLSNVDFTALGLTSWSTAFTSDTATTWDGANLSGLSLTLAGNNSFRGDTFVGTDFSDATINATGNQPFLTVGGTLSMDNVDFSGATFNLGAGNTIGFVAYEGGSGSLSGADFTDTVWIYTGGGNAVSFNIGPGSTSTADMALAADFSGADFSGVDNSNPEADSFENIVINLGLFDGATAIGAKYDANTVLPAGYTTADLDAAGWQNVDGVVVGPVLKGDVDLSGVVDFGDIGPFIGVLQAGTFQAEADVDCSTEVNFGDIGPFIRVLQGL